MAYSNKLINFFLKRKIRRSVEQLTPLQKDILKYVYENEPCTMEDIKKHFFGKRKGNRRTQT